MKQITTLLILLAFLQLTGYSQNPFPPFDSSALVSKNYNLQQLGKPYTIVVYGGVGCGYSKYLIENLHVLDECRNKASIVLLMDQPKDSIIKHMDKAIALYPTFSNSILQYKLKKKSDIFPQVLVFKDSIQVEHIVGIKEGMLTKIKNMITNEK
jgi:hypothetical protein